MAKESAGSARGKSAKKQTVRGTQKKAAKAKTAARKKALKSKVRLSRSSLRAAKSQESTNETMGDTAQKLKARKGQAPHSARISPVRGPVKAIASKTRFVHKEDADRNWLVVDAKGQTVGRLATEIAMILRGKHKPIFTPNNDAGDFVVVINADQLRFASTKEEKKRYHYHSGYIGGIKELSPTRLREKGQAYRILELAVKGMVPRTPLGRRQMKKLKIYNGSEHPHAAQKPQVWALKHSAA